MSNISAKISRQAGRQGLNCSASVALRLTVFLISLALLSFIFSANAETTGQTQSSQKVAKLTPILITIADKQIIATLADNPTARDFLSLLPLTVTLIDFNKTEKISDLPRRLSTDGAPAGFDPDEGAITYYAPWGNLAIFYRDFSYSAGLVNLGHTESDLTPLKQQGELTALIEKVE